MYISIEQLNRSLKAIDHVHPFFGIAFLAFKEAEIPIGTTKPVNFSSAADGVLNAFYWPTRDFDGYYQPLKTGNTRGRWVSSRYGSTSLQRITKDTFGKAFIHPAGSSDWGWDRDYLKHLQKLLKHRPIPAFHLAVWLFRIVELPNDIEPVRLVSTFFKHFKITSDEQGALFDSAIPKLASPWIRDSPIPESELLATLGFPPGYVPKEGVTLRTLELRDTGPAKHFKYEPATRLNIITGDNGLGKTFILESVWWALTGHWTENPILPHRESKNARLSYQLALGEHALPLQHCRFATQKLRWELPPEHSYAPGVVMYSRFDGSFAVLDPARIVPDLPSTAKAAPLVFHRQHVWHGLQADAPGGKIRKLCNGLLEDWVLWQRGGAQYERQYGALKACLEILSPADDDRLIIGEPVRLPGDTREIPTLSMDYGPVPVLHASAGVQRIITLAYMLVWTWCEHVVNSESLGQTPQRKLVLLIDEVEAHLHPRWQRVLVPGIMNVVKELWSDVSAQIHLATHSPLVMASAESVFDESCDDLHHLELRDKEVHLGELRFVKRGTVDAWLMSETFGLDLARSVEAENAIKAAVKLQVQNTVDAADVRRVHAELVKALAEDDKFWPRWRFFALKHGVDE